MSKPSTLAMYPTQSTNVMPIEKVIPNPPRNFMTFFDDDTILLLTNSNHSQMRYFFSSFLKKTDVERKINEFSKMKAFLIVL